MEVVRNLSRRLGYPIFYLYIYLNKEIKNKGHEFVTVALYGSL